MHVHNYKVVTGNFPTFTTLMYNDSASQALRTRSISEPGSGYGLSDAPLGSQWNPIMLHLGRLELIIPD